MKTFLSKISLKITPKLIAVLVGIFIIPGVVFAANKGYSYLQAKQTDNKKSLEIEMQEEETPKVKGLEDGILTREKQIDSEIEPKDISASPISSPTFSPSTPAFIPASPQPTPQEQIIYIQPDPLPAVQSGPSEEEQEFLDWLSAETEKKQAEAEARQQYCNNFYAEKNAALAPIIEETRKIEDKIANLWDDCKSRVRGTFTTQGMLERLYETELFGLNNELGKLKNEYNKVSAQYGECNPYLIE